MPKLSFIRPSPPRPSVKRMGEKEAADYLGVSVFTLRRIRKRGGIAFHEIGSQFFYTIQQLEAYIASTEITPCQTTVSKSANTTSSNTQTPPSTKPGGTTHKLDKHAAHHLALKTFKTPKKPLPSSS